MAVTQEELARGFKSGRPTSGWEREEACGGQGKEDARSVSEEGSPELRR